MYIAKENLETNRDEVLSFMRRFNFATIVTAKDNSPVATHLPLVVTEKGDRIVLQSHFAKANHQWKDISDNKVLVIFSEPHAYISPTHYDKKVSVPTWNYIAVHAYGTGRVIDETENALRLLESMIDSYEPSYREQWKDLPADYKLNMLKGIVAFEVVVTDIQASKKLSQDKSEQERQRIINTLSASSSSNEQLVADYMMKKM